MVKFKLTLDYPSPEHPNRVAWDAKTCGLASELRNLVLVRRRTIKPLKSQIFRVFILSKELLKCLENLLCCEYSRMQNARSFKTVGHRCKNIRQAIGY